MILALGGEECYNRLHNGAIQMDTMLNISHSSKLKNFLNLCENFDPNSILDRAVLFEKSSRTLTDSSDFRS